MPTSKSSKKKAAKKRPTSVSEIKEQLQAQAAPTPASEWNAPVFPDEGFVIELPSGKFCKVRRTLDLVSLLKSGKIPNPLAGYVRQMISGKFQNFDPSSMDGDSVLQMVDLMEDVICSMMVEPRAERPYVAEDDSEEEKEKQVNWEPSEGAISTEWLQMEDKMYLFAISQGFAADLKRFRDQQSRAMAALEASEGVPSTS